MRKKEKRKKKVKGKEIRGYALFFCYISKSQQVLFFLLNNVHQKD